jgi:hypothetical protein
VHSSSAYPNFAASSAATDRILDSDCRLTEITDSLVELFIQLVHRINARAERWVDKEMIAEFRRVRNKEHVLFRMAEAAVDHSDEVVRQAWWCSGSPSLCSPWWR